MDGAVRGLLGVKWKGAVASRVVVQRVDSRYVLRPEGFRLMLAGRRFTRDQRPGLEIPPRVDAVIEDSTLYVDSWVRAHAVLDLSAYAREATVAEAEEFVKSKQFSLAAGFDLQRVIDATVRRKITSISQNGILNRAAPAKLREYAAKFNLSVDVVKGKIVLPSEKKQFKAVLGLLDQDLLSFEPTDDRWIVNSKRRPAQ